MKPSTTSTTIVRELKQRRRWRQRERQKSNRSILTKQQLCTCIARLCTFLCHRCATSTWNCLNSRFVEYVNTRQRFCNSFLKHRYSPLEFISRKIHQHLTNWPTWNKSDEFFNSVNSRFKRRFHHRRGRCRLRCPRGGVLGLICPPPHLGLLSQLPASSPVSPLSAPSPSRLWLFRLETAWFGYVRLK